MPRTAAARKSTDTVATTITLPALADGEVYAGILLDETTGKPLHHVVLLAAKAKPQTWKDAIAWAKKQGGELPTRREQSLLFANAKQHFKPYWHWSSESSAGAAAFAWGQTFNYGGQYYYRKDDKSSGLAPSAESPFSYSSIHPFGELMKRDLTATIEKTSLPAIGEAYEGGIYAGLTLHNGAPHKLVLLPGEAEDVDWKKALAWATKQGGELPSRIDQLVLLQNLKREFKDAWYWSGESYAGDDAYAWGQGFSYGTQGNLHKDYETRARAVRRLPIE